MMAHNLCYTTLLDKATIDRLELVKDEDYIHTPNNGERSAWGRSICLWLTPIPTRLQTFSSPQSGERVSLLLSSRIFSPRESGQRPSSRRRRTPSNVLCSMVDS